SSQVTFSSGVATGVSITLYDAEAVTLTATDHPSGKTGTANLTVGAAGLDHLALTPSSSSITAGGSQGYTVEGFDVYNNSRGDVTAATTLSITPDGSCDNTLHTCTASVSGAHTVTGTDSTKTGTASLTVNPGALDHFKVEAAGGGAIGTQTAGTPFSVKVTAQDTFNNTVTGFTGTVDVSSNKTCSAGCVQSAAFTAGVLASHSVTLTQSGSG